MSDQNTPQEILQVGDSVKIYLNEKYGDYTGWHEGTVIKIDPYSKYRSFYWVELCAQSQKKLGIRQLSVFNTKNIAKIPSDRAIQHQ